MSDDELDVDIAALLGGDVDNIQPQGPLVLPAWLPQSTATGWKVFRRRFDEFWDAMAVTTDGMADLAALTDPDPPPASADEAFTTIASSFPSSFICRFIHHAAQRMTGTLALSNQRPTVTSVVVIWNVMVVYVEHFDKRYPTDLIEGVRRYIRNDLATELDLVDAARHKHVAGLDAIRSLLAVFFHPDLLMYSTRIRLQMAFWVALTVQSLLRVGACLKTAVAFVDKRNLTWHDLTIKVLRAGEVNSVSVVFIPPNGKTPKSRGLRVEIMPEDVNWANPVAYLLAVATYAKALPDNYRVADLYDPNIIPDGDTHINVSFSHSKKTEAVFLGVRGSEWAANTVRTYLVQASRALSLNYHFTPVLLRRSGAVAARRMGATAEQIQDMLAHKRSSTCYKKYIGDFEAVNVSGAVWGQDTGYNDALDLHPSMLKVSENPVALRHAAREEICRDEELVTMAAEHDERLVSILDSNKSEHVSELNEHAISELDKSFEAVRIKYNALYATFTSRDPESSLDAFPSAADCLYVATEALNFLANTQLNDPSSVIELMRANLDLLTPIADSVWDDLEERVARNNLGGLDLDGGVTSIPFPTTIDVSANRPQEGNENPDLDATLADLTGLLQNDAEDVDDDWHSYQEGGDVTPGTDFLLSAAGDMTALVGLSNTLFSGEPLPTPDLVAAMTALPATDFELFGYRAGHAPVGGACPVCKRRADDIVDEKDSTIKDRTDRNRHGAFRHHWQLHVRDCMSQVVVDQCKTDFPSRYPPILDTNPLTGEVMKATRTMSATAAATAAYVSMSVQGMFKRQKAKGNSAPPLSCAICRQDGVRVDIHGYGALKSHLAGTHSIYLPSSKATVTEAQVLKTVEEWNWDIAKYIFPLPVWVTALGRYILDPGELARARDAVLQQRLVEARREITSYGYRRDLKHNIPAERLAILAPISGPADAPSDNKYAVKRGRFSTVVIDFLCLICANDTTKPSWDRAAPHNNKVSDVVDHSSECGKVVGRILAKHFNGTGQHHYLCTSTDGKKTARCPDALCAGVVFEHAYQLYNHLFLVHKFKVRGTRVKATRNVSDYMFNDCKELSEWLGTVIPCKVCPRGESKGQPSGGNEEEDVNEAESSTKKAGKSKKGKTRARLASNDDDDDNDDELKVGVRKNKGKKRIRIESEDDDETA